MYCKNCGLEIANDSKFCIHCGFKQDRFLHKKDNVVFEEVLVELNELIQLKKTNEIIGLLDRWVVTEEDGNLILNNYSSLFNRNLVHDLSNLSNRYDKIKKYLERFIDLGLIEPNYPHKQATKVINSSIKWDEKETNSEKVKFNFPLAFWIVGIIIFVISYLFVTQVNKKAITSTSKPIDQYQRNADSNEHAQVGHTLEVGNFLFKVNRIQYRKTIGDEYYNETSDGLFLLIDLSLKNKSSNAHTLDYSFFTLEDLKGNIYESSSEGTTALELTGQETLFLKACNPNISKQGYLVFEVPAKDNYNLRLKDGFIKTNTKLVELTE